MERDFWLRRWNENQVGFHVKGVNPLLTRFWPEVAQTNSGRVLVPLCGKSEDLRWLAERGHDVVGVELSLLAAKAFAAEQQLVFAETHEPPFTVLRGNRITYYVGDFFDFSRSTESGFSLFYDRAALIALPPEMRPAYATHVASLLEARAHGLLIALEYDPSEMHGPPFTVPQGEVCRLFSMFECTKLLEFDCLEDEPRFKARGVTWMKEVVYQLKGGS
jgi:thiopurine S-methyltransferase